MKRVYTVIFTIYLVLPIFSIEPSLVGTTWELTYMDVAESGLSEIDNNNFEESLGDLNGDGIEEIMSVNMYMRFTDTKMKVYMKMQYSGSQAYFDAMGLKTIFTYTETDYSIVGNKIVSNEDDSIYEIKDNKLSFRDPDNKLMIFEPNNAVDLSTAQKDSDNAYY